MVGWIDRMPTWARDLGFMLLAAVLAWAGSTLVPVLEAQSGLVATLGAPLLVLLVTAATRWTQAYGRGNPTASAVAKLRQLQPSDAAVAAARFRFRADPGPAGRPNYPAPPDPMRY